jgi:hypothetical protein
MSSMQFVHPAFNGFSENIPVTIRFFVAIRFFVTIQRISFFATTYINAVDFDLNISFFEIFKLKSFIEAFIANL